LALAWAAPNTGGILERWRTGRATATGDGRHWFFWAGAALGVAVLVMNAGRVTEFVYFQF
jgi:hypothetical protein